MLITFWASDFFVSENGVRVKQGYTLKTEVVRQIPNNESELLKTVSMISAQTILLIIISFFLVALVISSETFAVWALFDTIQLFAHLPLVRVAIPG